MCGSNPGVSTRRNPIPDVRSIVGKGPDEPGRVRRNNHMNYEKPLIDRLPEPVRDFVEDHDVITVFDDPEEAVRWGIKSPDGDVTFEIIEESDEDGVDVTCEIRAEGREVFGYINPRTFMAQELERAPILTGKAVGLVLRFNYHGETGEIDIGLGVNSADDPVFHIFGFPEEVR